MTRTWKFLIALDQMLGSLLFEGIAADETISAYCWRRGYARRVAMIDWIMRDPDHCRNSWISERSGTQNAPEYRETVRDKFERESG